MSESELVSAVTRGDVAEVRELLAADPALAAARDEHGLSAVLLACYHRQVAVRDALLAAKPPLDALELAALGDADGLRARIAAEPAAVRARSADGFTPLHYAAFFGGGEAVELLLAAGADANAVAENPTRLRPLHSAAAVGDHAAARALLDAGADPNVAQQGGFTPLHAAAGNDDAELAQLLLERGADPAARTDEGADARSLAGERVAAVLGA